MTSTIPHQYQGEIADLAKETANRLAKLGNKPSPRKRKAIIDEAAKSVMEISLRIVFDDMAKAVIQAMGEESGKPQATKCYHGAAPQPLPEQLRTDAMPELSWSDYRASSQFNLYIGDMLDSTGKLWFIVKDANGLRFKLNPTN